MFWGMSPALDLQEEYLKYCDPNTCELNLLVVGGCDARHLLKTLAQAHRHTRRRINLFAVDACPELVARQVLLLALALERTDRVGLLEKSRRFLEIYGNTLLRPSTSRYAVAKARQLAAMITDPDYMRALLPLLSVDQVKFRDRDYMEDLLNFWATGHTNQFDARSLWDRRLRRALAARYDTRAGVFDWDYHMRLKDVASIVGAQEYKHFRESGVAFTWLETEVCRPNTTLAAGVYRCGERYLHSGYLGDVATGPFVAYGLDCEDAEMLKRGGPQGSQFFKRSTDVSERNVMRMLFELERRERFDAAAVQDAQRDLGLTVLAPLDARQSGAAREPPLVLRESRDTYVDAACGKVHFLSLSALEHCPGKPEFRGLFHAAFLGHGLLSRTRPAVLDMVREGGLVLFETRKFAVELKREDVKAFGDQINELAAAGRCAARGQCDPQQDSVARFVVERGGAGDAAAGDAPSVAPVCAAADDCGSDVL